MGARRCSSGMNTTDGLDTMDASRHAGTRRAGPATALTCSPRQLIILGVWWVQIGDSGPYTASAAKMKPFVIADSPFEWVQSLDSPICLRCATGVFGVSGTHAINTHYVPQVPSPKSQAWDSTADERR